MQRESHVLRFEVSTSNNIDWANRMVAGGRTRAMMSSVGTKEVSEWDRLYHR
jgi:hypothetical protein